MLIFSQGLRLLDLVEMCILKASGISYLRVDGLTSMSCRAARVDKFKAGGAKVMLLTTAVGGFGLNLTRADRVVMLDPAWNPAVDAQAVDRVYRIGQTREVRVYRFAMSGLIEDKMIRLQVFKLGLTKTALETKHQPQYFTAREIRSLFTWTDPQEGETRQLLLKDGKEEGDREVARVVRKDGGPDGWLEAGPAVALSNFSALFTCLAEDPSNYTARQISTMQQKLEAADEQIKQAEDARLAAERQLGETSEAFHEATRHVVSASTDREEAEASLLEKERQSEKLFEFEASAVRYVEEACRARDVIRVDLAKAQKRNHDAETNSESCASRMHTSRSALLASEEALCEAMDTLERSLLFVDSDGRATNGNLVDVGAVGLKVTRRAIEETRVALKAVNDLQTKLEAFQECLVQSRRVRPHTVKL